MRFAACLLVVFVCSGALASEPGQPLDCSDWTIELPGITCVAEVPFPCGGPNNTLDVCVQGVTVQANTEGDLLYFKTIYLGVTYCDPGSSGIGLYRYEFTRLRNGAEERIAYMQDRCDRTYGERLQLRGLTFDATHGKLRLAVRNLSGIYGGGEDVGSQLLAFTGFATTFEVLQTYTPQSALGFRVPAMPEGMAGADSFDTYWGSLSKPLDFTQAHALACDYPATPPTVGDYLTVADTVPTPAPGAGVYYVTAATYQGATRYGRKTTAGHLTGRDPALLPACTP